MRQGTSGTMKTEELEIIARQFPIQGSVTGIEPIGNGHINDTYLVMIKTDHEDVSFSSGMNREVPKYRKVILQRINEHVFEDPAALMENITAVASHIGGRLFYYPAPDGNYWYRAESGFWRMMSYIDNAYSCETAEDPSLFREIGHAYGAFIEAMADFPSESLHETIPGFHDTRRRFKALTEAIRKTSQYRKEKAADEISFALSREKDVDLLNDCVARGEIPVRVTHNDTKINNVLLDRNTGKAVCVIDLDTVMPGLSVNEFGDAVRSGAATGREDEPDAESISLDLDLYRSFAQGFIEGCPGLTQKEIELMPVGARIMALECGIRFLTDYLEGDHYFKTDYPGQNLIRCRTQFRLVRSMEDRWDQMQFR